MADPTMMPAADPMMGGQEAQPGATKTVCIEQDASGALMVGLEPAGAETGMPEGSPGEMAQDKSYMKPAKNIEDALNQARQLLEGDETGEMTVEQAFQGGFNGK